MIEVKSSELAAFLGEKGFTVEHKQETDQLHLMFKEAPREWPAFIRLYQESGLLTTMGFFPVRLEEEAVNDMARLLHLFNKELDVPGFGMDEDSKTVFFRALLPTRDGHVHPELVSEMVETVKSVCRQFSPAIEAIASGATTLAQIQQEAEKMQKEAKS